MLFYLLIIYNKAIMLTTLLFSYKMEVKDMKSLMSIPYFKSIVSNNQELSDPKNELLKFPFKGWQMLDWRKRSVYFQGKIFVKI